MKLGFVCMPVFELSFWRFYFKVGLQETNPSCPSLNMPTVPGGMSCPLQDRQAVEDC